MSVMLFAFFHAVVDLMKFAYDAEGCYYACGLEGEFRDLETEMQAE